MKNAILILSFMGLTANSSAIIINIPSDYLTIQQGISASSDGDTVLVQPGTYYENINFSGHNITVAGNYIFSGDTTDIWSTIINGSQPQHSDTASCVRIVSGEDSTAALVGFTLTGGYGTVWRDIHNNLWYREGGGIIIELSSPVIRDNIIIDNEAVDDTGIRSAGGGGIRAGDGNPVIERNLIAYNEGLYGGGIVLNYATGIIRNNIIHSNSGGEDYGGGGLWSYGGGVTLIENNTIVNNSSDLDGGGILVWATSIVVRNNIIYLNSDLQGSPQIRVRPGSSANVTFSDIEGGWGGPGNIDANPLFRNISISDFRLMSVLCGDTLDSPCIDAGDPMILDEQLECLWGLGGFRSDMGAYGGGDSATTSIDDDHLSLPVQYMLMQNYPNPFNSGTTIRYSIVNPSEVRLAIYDLLGREVRVLVDDYRRPGLYSMDFDPADLPSGIYFYSLRAGNAVEIKRMVLLK